MHWAKIRKEDIANGPGIRVSLFVQGCNRHCKNCFNPETWDFNDGFLWNKRIQTQFLDLATPKNIVGFSILGGEPLQQDGDMLNLIKAIKDTYPNKTIWMWTGYKFEDLNPSQREIVNLVDVLVDGEFIEEQKNPLKKFRGSTNQRIIDIQKTIQNNDNIVLHDLYY